MIPGGGSWQAFEMPDPFAYTKQFSNDLDEVMQWIAISSDAEIMQFRETAVAAIERAAAGFRDGGHCEQWFAGSDTHVKRVAGAVNGPLLEVLVKAAMHPDASCTELFRKGMCASCYQGGVGLHRNGMMLLWLVRCTAVWAS